MTRQPEKLSALIGGRHDPVGEERANGAEVVPPASDVGVGRGDHGQLEIGDHEVNCPPYPQP